MAMVNTRRKFLASTSALSAGLLIGCPKDDRAENTGSGQLVISAQKSGSSEPAQPEVTATEDLMREHGVIRRALVVYREAAMRLRSKPAEVPSDALRKAAKLIHDFGEDYHEMRLEETHIFPALKRAGGAVATQVDVLLTQHGRGREITEYVMAATASAIALAQAEGVARALEAFARMYEEHAAVEDTIVFPAWKKTMSAKQLDDMGELFEDIEHKAFGKDGFDDAVDQIVAVERAFGFELAHFTAPTLGKP